MAGKDGGSSTQQRLDSWKEIGAYFGRDERTVKRWETERGLPVHRVPGSGRGRVYAYPEELTDWLQGAGVEIAIPLTADPVEIDDRAAGNRPPASAVPFSALEFNHGGAATARAPEAAPRLALVQRPMPVATPPAVVADQAASAIETSAPILSPEVPAVATTPPNRTPAWIAAGVMLLVCAIGGSVGWINHQRTRQADSLVTAAANAQAENLYLQGKFFFQQRTAESLTKAVDLFTQSIVHDPHYAPAYAGLAECYELLREFSNMPDGEAFPRALSAAQQAVQLNPNMAQGHAALAFAQFYWSWDTRRALEEYALALKLDPTAAQTHHWYATSLMTLGEGDKALQQIDEAQKLDPGSRAILADKGWILSRMGRLDQAETVLHQVEQSDPQFVSPHEYLAWIGLMRGDGAEYAREMRIAATLLHDPQQLELVELVDAAYKRGGTAAMNAALDQHIRNAYAATHAAPASMAGVLARSGDVNGAFPLLDEAFQHRDSGTRFLLIDPSFLALHHDARFIAVQQKLGVDMESLGQ